MDENTTEPTADYGEDNPIGASFEYGEASPIDLTRSDYGIYQIVRDAVDQLPFNNLRACCDLHVDPRFLAGARRAVLKHAQAQASEAHGWRFQTQQIGTFIRVWRVPVRPRRTPRPPMVLDQVRAALEDGR